MTKVSSDSLISALDDVFHRLLKEAYPVIPADGAPAETGPKVGFVDKLRLFDSGVKWVATKNKVDPESEQDEFAIARERLAGGTRRSGATGASSSRSSGSGH